MLKQKYLLMSAIITLFAIDLSAHCGGDPAKDGKKRPCIECHCRMDESVRAGAAAAEEAGVPVAASAAAEPEESARDRAERNKEELLARVGAKASEMTELLTVIFANRFKDNEELRKANARASDIVYESPDSSAVTAYLLWFGAIQNIE